MSVVLLLLSTCWCVSASIESPRFYPLEHAHIYFKEFISKFDKQYNKHEKKQRFEIFKENLKVINRINEETPDILLAINHFSDFTNEEFVRMYTGLRTDDDYPEEVRTDEDIPEVNAPESFDWREKNVVTRVRQQGRCGSCWAQSVADLINIYKKFRDTLYLSMLSEAQQPSVIKGLLESQHAIETGELLELSAQQLVDCDTGSEGCCGGKPWHAVNSTIKSGGIMEEEEYMYRAFQDFCRFNYNNVVVKVNEVIVWFIESQEKIKQLLFQYGPISIGLRATGMSHYKEGIIKKGELCTAKINHAGLLVGYGFDNKTEQPYWIVKNSWGHRWGEEGYFRMARGEGEESCGMQTYFFTTAKLAKL